MPLVSAIIPIYNAKKYVCEAIHSALTQTYEDLEIIVIDDGSTDGSESALQCFLDRINYSYQENAGVAAARNRAIRASRGKYIAFLDSDDLWLAYKTVLQVKYLDLNDDTALVYGDHSTFDKTGIVDDNFAFSRRLPRVSGHIFKDLIENCLFQTSTVMVRREVFEEVGFFNESLTKGGEDYDLWLRISATGKIGYIGQVVSQYRYTWPPVFQDRMLEEEPILVEVIKTALEMFPNLAKEIPGTLVEKRFGRIYQEIGFTALWQREFSHACYNFRQSLDMHPWNPKAIGYYAATRIFPNLAYSIAQIAKSRYPICFFEDHKFQI